MSRHRETKQHTSNSQDKGKTEIKTYNKNIGYKNIWDTSGPEREICSLKHIHRGIPDGSVDGESLATEQVGHPRPSALLPSWAPSWMKKILKRLHDWIGIKASIQQQGLHRQLSGIESTYQCRRHRRCRFDLWVGKMPWRGNGNPPQYSCLENPMVRGAWWARVHRVTQSQT